MNPLIFCSYIVLGLMICVVVFHQLIMFKSLHFLKSIASASFGILIIAFVLYLSFFYVYLMYGISVSVYSISKYILVRFLEPVIAYYFSFLISLVFIAYFIEKIGVVILQILRKIPGNNSYDMSSGFKKIVRVLKPKLWIYMVAAIFTSISSIENLAQISVITNNTWNEVKPFLFEALITFIALDTFIVLINKEILSESKKLISNYLYEIYKSIVKDNDANGSE